MILVTRQNCILHAGRTKFLLVSQMTLQPLFEYLLSNIYAAVKKEICIICNKTLYLHKHVNSKNLNLIVRRPLIPSVHCQL